MKETLFKDFISIQRGHDLPERMRVHGEIPVVGSNGIVGFHNLPKGIVPGLTIGRSGSIGNINFLEKPYFPLNTTLYVTDFKGNNEKFVYYFLKNFDFSNFDSGSVQPSLNRNYIYTATVKYPDVGEQKIIAEFLESFDSKIELNQKMNETLEEIARTLFKSWFVDFDPVRAKAEGRPTGLSKEISDLFPDSFEDSELGEIPKGWQIIRLKDLAKEVGKKIKKGKETKEKPYVPIDEISSEQLFLSQYKNGDEANSSLVSFLKDDILFGAMRPYFHKVCVAPFDGTTRTTCLVLSSIDKCYSSFLVFFLFQKSTIDYATQNSTGSTIPYIKWQNYLENLELCLPPKEIGLEFKEFTSPILKKFQQHIFETRNLLNMRDTLLPKLISGELKIPDTENLIEEAGI